MIVFLSCKDSVEFHYQITSHGKNISLKTALFVITFQRFLNDFLGTQTAVQMATIALSQILHHPVRLIDTFPFSSRYEISYKNVSLLP